MNCSAIHCQCSDHSTDLITLPGHVFPSIDWFSEVLEAGISQPGCELIVKLILDISSFQVFEQPVQ